jgi:hypothetical protein
MGGGGRENFQKKCITIQSPTKSIFGEARQLSNSSIIKKKIKKYNP